MKVLVNGAANDVTGYGNDTLGLCSALMKWGCDVYLQPSNVHPPLPPQIAALLTKPLPVHVDLALTHRCPQELASPRSFAPRSVATVSLAWSMWEWESLENVDRASTTNCEHSLRVTDVLSRELSVYDSLLAYDNVSYSALSPYHVSTHILQGGIEIPAVQARDWFGSPFRFLMLGALHARKNPIAAALAFKELKAAGEIPDAELILKTVSAGLPKALEEWCPGIRVVAEVWPPSDLDSLMGMCQVLLAPSRGEGKNIPALRFAASGGAVAATKVGGHEMWLSEQIGFLLDYEWRDSIDGRGAEVDPSHLAEVMLRLYRDRGETRRRAEMAARVLPAMVSWDRVVQRLCDGLEGYAGPRGAEVQARMRAARREEPPPGALEQAGLAALSTRR